MGFKKIKRGKIKKYTEGAISLFLVVVMLPFLSIASMLVEMNRFNSCVSILDEIMGSASLSTLAHYDTFLKDRFGLLAVSQERDINMIYSDYIEQNSRILGNSLTINKLNAIGKYSLDSSELLFHQLMEFSAYNSPAKLASEISVNILENVLDSFFEAKSTIENILDNITSTSDMISDATELYRKFSKFEEKIADFEDKEKNYNEAFSDFDAAVVDLATEMNDYNSEDDESQEDYDKTINSLKRKVVSKKRAYIETQNTIKNLYISYADLIEESYETISDIGKNIDSLGVNITKNMLITSEKKVEKLNNDLKNLSNQDEAYFEILNEREKEKKNLSKMRMEYNSDYLIKEFNESVSESSGNILKKYTRQSIQNYINDFEVQIKTINNDLKTIPENEFFLTEENSYEYCNGLDKNTYHNAVVSGYMTCEEIERFSKSQMDALTKESLFSFLDGLEGISKAIFKSEGFFDSDLSANINIDYYNTNLGGLPGGEADENWAVGIVQKISDVMSTTIDLKDEICTFELANPIKKLYKIARKLLSLFQKIIDLFKEIIKNVIRIGTNILNLFKNHERLNLSIYSVYNMPCRTDYKSFTPMTGANIKGYEYMSAHGSKIISNPISDLAALIKTITVTIEGSGSDLAFNGADLEYIITGSNSGVANQLSVFCGLYFLRLISNILPVSLNPDVEEIASLSGPLYPIVLACILLLEPLLDNIVLVNGGDIPIYKTTIFLTPKGIVSYIGKLTSLKFDKDILKSHVEKVFDQSISETSIVEKTADSFAFDYKSHCLLIMLIDPSNEQQLARIKNIIQMESLYYYKEKNMAFHPFKLTEAYSFIESSVDAKVNNFLPLPTLSADSLFSVTREQVRGY